MSKKILPTRPKRKFEHQIFAYYEGDQEEVYFSHLKTLINKHSENDLKIKIVSKNCGGGNPKTPVLTAIKNCSANKTPLVVFDFDNKKMEFEEAIDLSIKNKFNMGYSNINFDYWLALHKLEKNKIIYGEKSSNDAYVKILKKVYQLSDRDDVKNSDIIKKMVSKITLDDVFQAIDCCKLIEKHNRQTPEKECYTQKNNIYYTNPDMQIYKVVEKLLKICLKTKTKIDK